MPNLRDKIPEMPSSYELNPLTNPVLERNLGRWAKVYFSHPPAQRAQAVSDLLEEIKQETGMGPSAAPVRPYFPRAHFPAIVCSACQRQNPPGHRFCSRCGETLSPPQNGSTEHSAAPPAPQAPPLAATDVQWLRDQAFSGLNGSNVPHRQGWKYVVAAAAMVLAGFAYMQWAPRTAVPPAATTIAPQGDAAVAPLPPLKSAEADAPPETRKKTNFEHQNPSSATPAHERTTAPSGVQAASQKSPLLDATASHQENGASDLRLAQRYLGRSMGVRDSAEAAKMLWKAVGKQNTAAAVLLSDLYLRGDGVPRSCDQARLLLVAAAKRGDAQAAEHLQRLESQGCR